MVERTPVLKWWNFTAAKFICVGSFSVPIMPRKSGPLIRPTYLMAELGWMLSQKVQRLRSTSADNITAAVF